ncbi:hypothetical protein KEM56_000912 [Ascosphaera pollenicola]|nr:hypothetical protein KEM56_000912 [Ascosphaera pollenicola]
MGYAAKRRKLFKNEGPTEEEIKFDNAARAEFLTGFHKRKVQRAKHAQEAAERRMKEEKREQRKRLREERQAELRRAFEVHQARLREINGTAPGSDSDENENEEADGEEAGSNNEWNGVAEPEPVDHTAEYIDEDKYTTVTVEEIDPKNGFGSDSESDDDDEEKDTENGDKKTNDHKEEEDKNTEKKKKRVWSKNAPDKPKKPKRKRNFKYETKDERKVSRFKERTGNRKKAKERKGK